jgi:Ca2+-binding RTX toxin-like protein
MAFITGNDSDNRLRGTSASDTIRGKGGNDILEGFGGADTLLGGKNDDDILVGGSGTDTLIAWGDDILVGGGANQYDDSLLNNLKNDPFQTRIAGDRQRDTFIAINKDELDYTLTIADYEVNIDRIDLRGFGVRSASHFEEIQNKGNWFEAITREVNGGQLVLRINADPTSLNYVI